MFGPTAEGWPGVRAIVDYVHGRLRLDYRGGGRQPPRIGRMVMAYGLDGTECALTTSFGPAPLAGVTVDTDEIVDGG